jgi:FKBP-type peptidyl-prolyl cis-trans isomerase
MEFGINYFCSVCERRFEDNAQLKACSECKQVYYCCKDHQKEGTRYSLFNILDWKKHKPKCKNVRTAERTGVVLKTITPGDGKTFPLSKQKVWVHYIGTFINGRQFDSSVSRQAPFSFIVGTQQVIRGWDVAITQMTVKEVKEYKIY